MGRGGLQGVVLLIGALLLGACSDVAGPDDRDSIEAWMEFHRVPGVSVAVIKEFEIAYLEQYGVLDRNTAVPVDENTRFQAASLSKSVSAVVVLSLVEDWVVALDDDVEGYLTSWELPWAVPRGDEPVTLRRLLSHTAGTTVSGFRGYRDGESLPTLLDILNGAAPANSDRVVVAETPGATFSYSGGGYEVMEQAIYDVTGRTWPELARTQVLDPLGMSRSTFRQPAPDSLQPYFPTGYYADGSVVPGGHHTYPEIAAAGLWTTPEDMALFLIDLQRSLRGDSGGVLTRASAELLVTEVRRQYGLGFDLSTRLGQPYFGHQGANDGFRGGMIAHRSSGDGAVILTNSDRGSDLFADVVRLIGARESWPGH